MVIGTRTRKDVDAKGKPMVVVKKGRKAARRDGDDGITSDAEDGAEKLDGGSSGSSGSSGMFPDVIEEIADGDEDDSEEEEEEEEELLSDDVDRFDDDEENDSSSSSSDIENDEDSDSDSSSFVSLSDSDQKSSEDEDEDEGEENVGKMARKDKNKKTAKKMTKKKDNLANDNVDDDDNDDDDKDAPPKEQKGVGAFGIDPTVARGYVHSKPLYEGGVASDEDSSSDEEMEGFTRNTVGNIPMEWYNDEDHIGYDISGNRITKQQRRDELDELIAKADDPDYWRTVRDDVNDRDVKLSNTELDMLRRIKENRFPDAEFDPYPEYVDWFDYEDGAHPLSNRPEPKSRFLPSRHEHKKIMKMVRAIRRGDIKPKRAPSPPKTYLLWDNENPTLTKYQQNLLSLPAPKVTPPGHAYSYNPPEEYLPTEEELAAWAEMEVEDRPFKEFIPRRFPNLRSVVRYDNAIKERFERCLDLYMCPRTRKMRINIDPKTLIPKLPKPKDLAPFPTTEGMLLTGHEGAVRSVSVSPGGGEWIASGGDDSIVRVWDMRTGRCRFSIPIGAAAAAQSSNPRGRRGSTSGSSAVSPIDAVMWSPNPAHHLLLVACGESVYIVAPRGASESTAETTEAHLVAPESSGKGANDNDDGDGDGDDSEGKPVTATSVKWRSPAKSSAEWRSGVRCVVTLRKRVKQIAWHAKGDYFSTVSPSANTTAVAVHQLSKRHTQFPFRNLKGQAQCVAFHPVRPMFFIATQRHVRVYNLAKQELTRKLLPGCRWISSIAVHPGGDNVVIGSYDRRVSWHDMDYSSRPLKSMRFSEEGVRHVVFHPRLPLFASASDDGNLYIYHGMVYNDFETNALILPLTKLRGHVVTRHLGPMSCAFHPTQPWIVSGGSDGTVRVWTDLN